MSSIFYYSNFCSHSQSILQKIAKMDNRNGEIHFICVDKRVKEDNKIYLILENNSRIVLPETVTRVPALFLLSEGYKVVYGDQILHYFRPRETLAKETATNNFMEPMAFSLGNGGSVGSSIVSDQFSFLDMAPEELTAQGNGGIRQMHNYVDLSMKNGMEQVQYPTDNTYDKKTNKLSDQVTIKNLQQQRELEDKQLVIPKKY